MNTSHRVNKEGKAFSNLRTTRATGKRWRALVWVMCATVLFGSNLSAAPGIITTSISATGSLALGSFFSATFAISGYTDAVEIDGFNFKVNYDPVGLSFIGSALNDSPGSSANWLRSSPQDGVSGTAILTDFTTSIAGEVRISAADLRLPSTRGTLAATGLLCRVDFQVIGVGSGLITPSPSARGTVLFANNLAPAGVPLFTGATIPPVTYRLRISRSGPNVRISWPSPATGFVLEENLVLRTTNWTAVPQMPADDGTNKAVMLSAGTGKNFFRLKKP